MGEARGYTSGLMGTHVQATLANVKEAKSAELGARTVMQLKAQCTQHGLRKTGTKAELVARLCDKLCTAEPLDVKQPTCNWTFGSCGVSIPATHHLFGLPRVSLPRMLRPAHWGAGDAASYHPNDCGSRLSTPHWQVAGSVATGPERHWQ